MLSIKWGGVHCCNPRAPVEMSSSCQPGTKQANIRVEGEDLQLRFFDNTLMPVLTFIDIRARSSTHAHTRTSPLC